MVTTDALLNVIFLTYVNILVIPEDVALAELKGELREVKPVSPEPFTESFPET